MRAVLQRVSRAKVTVGDAIVGEIGRGVLVLLGVSVRDESSDADKLLEKIVSLRIFEDNAEKMNLSLVDINGEMLVVSQFTLFANTSQGRRPSFIDAAGREQAVRLYDHFVDKARGRVKLVATGKFGAMMDVELVNGGPVTIILDTEKE